MSEAENDPCSRSVGTGAFRKPGCLKKTRSPVPHLWTAGACEPGNGSAIPKGLRIDLQRHHPDRFCVSMSSFLSKNPSPSFDLYLVMP